MNLKKIMAAILAVSSMATSTSLLANAAETDVISLCVISRKERCK